MRIAIIVNEFPAVSETFILNKVKMLADSNHSITVFCSRFNKKLWKDLVKQKKNIHPIALNKTTFRFYLLKNPQDALKIIGNSKRSIYNHYIIQTLNSVNADVIHFEFSGIAASLSQSLYKLQAKVIVSCRGSAEKVKLAESGKRKAEIAGVFNAVNAIHCVSGDLKQTILPYCQQPEKIFINHPGINIKKFTPKPKSSSNVSLKILSVGRLVFQKGYVTGLQVMQKLLTHDKKFQWIIIGEGPQRDELMWYIKDMGLEQNVILPGMKNPDNIVEILNEADIFFLPSVTEGMANSALEAMCMEVPVISTNCGGMPEAITHMINGLLSDTYDVDGLYENFLLLMDNVDLRKKLGVNARNTIIEKFSLQRNVDAFEKLYTSLQ